ncbi:hypothetical protein KCU59_g66, partial [Aureobasidium melanogenum]
MPILPSTTISSTYTAEGALTIPLHRQTGRHSPFARFFKKKPSREREKIGLRYRSKKWCSVQVSCSSDRQGVKSIDPASELSEISRF